MGTLLIAMVLGPRLALAGPALSPDFAEVRLYPTFEAWRQRSPSRTVSWPLRAFEVDRRRIGDPGLEPMWVLDRQRSASRADGEVFALEHDGNWYFNEAAPPAHRGRPYGRLVTNEEWGVYQRRQCYVVGLIPLAGYIECDVAIRLVNLETGSVVKLTRRALRDTIADYPDLLAAFEAEKRQHAGTIRRYALAWLERASNDVR